MNEDLNTLMKIKNSLENEELASKVDNAKVSDPAREIEKALSSFVTSKLSRIEEEAQFSDLIKMHLRQRFPEFTIDQLIELNNQVTKNNNKAMETLLPLFQGDTGGKIITEHLKDSSVESTAKKLYDTADKDMLQALSYFSSTIERALQKSSKPITGEAEIVSDN